MVAHIAETVAQRWIRSGTDDSALSQESQRHETAFPKREPNLVSSRLAEI